MAGQDRTTPAGVSAGPLASLLETMPSDTAGERSRAEGELLDLLSRVSSEPWTFDFFQLMRRVEALAARANKSPGLGRSMKASQDPVRLGQEPSLAFAPRTVGAAKTRAGLTRLYVNFMGMLGPQGPMPLHFTEYVRSREHQSSDPTMARFLDVFNHRMASLFYRAWAMNRPAVSHDRSAADPADSETDRFGVYVASQFGLGMPTLRNRDSIPDASKQYFAGRLASPQRPAEGLVSILSDFFGVRATIEEMAGRWIDLPAQYRSRLGHPETAVLGTSVIAGSRVWDCQSMFRLTLGPMDLSRYERLLPGTQGFDRLRDWIRLYAGTETAWEVRLVLRKDCVPMPRLPGKAIGGKNPSTSGIRLGYTTWMVKAPPTQDAADVLLSSESAGRMPG